MNRGRGRNHAILHERMAHGGAPFRPEVVVGELKALAHPVDHQEISENLHTYILRVTLGTQSRVW